MRQFFRQKSAKKLYTDNDSYVSVLNGANTVQFYTDALNENTLNISGNAGKSVALTADGTTYTAKNESADTKGEGSTYTRGFHLAGVDIPYPAGDYVQKTGTVSLAGDAALCWVQRCTTEGKVAWVLSLVNGSCPATKTNISCSATESSSKGLTWQIKSENWGGAETYLPGECDNETYITCDTCCRRLSSSNLDNIIGTSCNTAGETKHIFSGVKEDPRPYDDNLSCHCSGYYTDIICQ